MRSSSFADELRLLEADARETEEAARRPNPCLVCDGKGYVETGHTFGLAVCETCHGSGVREEQAP